MHSISIPLTVDSKSVAESSRKSIIIRTSFVLGRSMDLGGHGEDERFGKSAAGLEKRSQKRSEEVFRGSRRNVREYTERNGLSTVLDRESCWQNSQPSKLATMTFL